MIKARDLITGAAFGPDTVKDLQAAFAQAWDALAPGVPEEEHEAVRARLARTLLALRSGEPLSAATLRDAALKVMRAQYRSGLGEAQHANAELPRRASDVR